MSACPGDWFIGIHGSGRGPLNLIDDGISDIVNLTSITYTGRSFKRLQYILPNEGFEVGATTYLNSIIKTVLI